MPVVDLILLYLAGFGIVLGLVFLKNLCQLVVLKINEYKSNQTVLPV